MSKPVALITGASRGIGRGIALELARTHALVATYRGRLDAAETLRAETGAEIIQADIGSAADRVRRPNQHSAAASAAQPRAIHSARA